MKTISKFLFLFTLILSFNSCSEDDIVETLEIKSGSIVDVASSNNQLSTLVAAVTRADLGSVLTSTGPFTVLAPTNQAFTDFLADNNFESLNDVPVALLREVLLNHVIDGRLESTDLTTSYANTNATSDASNTPMSIYINTSNGVKFNGISTVTSANVSANNGIVHIVDKVIGLPTVVTFALADPNFSTLVAALTREDLDTDFVEILNRPASNAIAPYTVFGPTNTAFTNFLTELELDELSDIPKETLDTTLRTHVLTATNSLDSALSDGLELTAFSNQKLTANVTGGATLTDQADRISNITATNVQANNGVIHTIDKVLSVSNEIVLVEVKEQVSK